MEAQPDFSVKNFTPGRLRVAFPPLVSHKELTRSMKGYLTNGRGVTRVTANHYCGSITIYYNPEIAEKNSFIDMLNNVTWDKLAQLNDQSLINREEDDHKNQPSKGKRKKGLWNFWNLAGSFFVGVGIVGIFLPLLPTVPLLIIAAFCYWRGSPKFYNWLINLGAVGKLIKDFREGKGLPAKAKFHAILYMWISMGISITFFVSNMALKMTVVLVGIGVTVYILRIKTSDLGSEH